MLRSFPAGANRTRSLTVSLVLFKGSLADSDGVIADDMPVHGLEGFIPFGCTAEADKAIPFAEPRASISNHL